MSARLYHLTLPEDFQEVLMTNEMELQNGITVEVLRKLVYLYTRGMEYYDLAGKEKFRVFYSDKLVNLLTRKDIVEFLDKNTVNFEDKEDLDKLFSQPQKKIRKSTTNEDRALNIDSRKFTNIIRRNSIKLVKPDINLSDINLFVRQKILEVSANLNKIDQAMTNEIIDQMTEFEENKRNMEVRNSPYIINQDEAEKNNENNVKEENKENENDVKEIKNEEDELKLIEQINFDEIDKNKGGEALKKLNSNSELIGKNPMLNEIEEFVQKNMDEMYQQLEELKASFEDEIKEAEASGLTEIADGLREDLESELENLKDQYEEQRRIETEKIKQKYSRRNSLMLKNK